MSKAELAKRVYEKSYLTGQFTLRSGQTSHEYFDKYRFESDPNLLRDIASHMAELIPSGTDYLAGLEMGGIPIATAISLHTGIPTIFVRKEAKKYGTCKIAEGAEFAGKKVIIIEDVITTGGQVLESARELAAQGALIQKILCVILRAPTNPFADYRLSSLFTMEELKNAASTLEPS